jgi:hypothetical protein
MNNNFNLKQFLTEGILLKEERFYAPNYVKQKYGNKASEIENNIHDEEDNNPNIWDLYTSLESPEEVDDFVQGFINESELNEEAQVDENLIKSIFDEKVQDDYKPLIGTDPIYDGLEEVLNSPKTFQKVAEWVKDQFESSGEDLEEGDEAGYASDATDYSIMEAFAPRLVQNLIKAGFTYDKGEDDWTVPESYSDKTDYEALTSYGVIYDIWGLGGDYDTSPRETISQFLTSAAEQAV